MQAISPVFNKVVVKSIKKSRASNDQLLERQSHCENWRRSGLTMSHYCRQTGIALSSFSKWVQDSKSPSPPPVVIEKRPPVEIILTNGIRVQIAGPNSVSGLVKLLQEVSSCN